MKYQVKDPQGQMHIIDGPEGATPDQVIAQAQKLIPQQSKPVQQSEPDWKGVVGQATKEAFMMPGTMTRKMASDPTAQAKMLPPLAGAVGAMSPIPGGATLGTVGGRQLSNLALKSYGQSDQIPSGLSQGLEAGAAVLGDVAAIPALKKASFGKQIGVAETAAGLGSVPKEAPPGSMRTAVKWIQAMKDKPLTVQEAKQFKPAIDTVLKKGWLRGTQYEPDAVQFSQKIQSTLNQIPGRAEASAGMAKAMTIPRMMNKGYQMIPKSVRHGLGYGTGVGAAGGASYELIRKLLGG